MKYPEAQVVLALKQYLLRGGLGGVSPGHVVVDADPSYIHSRFARELEPMARVTIAGGRPDLLCATERTEGVLVSGFEVKASSADWVPGLAQARRYRSGVHHSYLALPGQVANVGRDVGGMAREIGVGVLVLEGDEWHEVSKPADPLPLPWSLAPTSAALEGVPVARQLQLNHPLNYLVVPLLAATLPPGRGLLEELEARWPDLGSAGTRRHAVVGATSLHLINAKWSPTSEGYAVADLLLGLGFTPETRPAKRARLADVAPSIGAVARFVLLRQAVVRLLLRSLAQAGGMAPLPKLAMIAAKYDPPLAGALFLADPSGEVRTDLNGESYNPTTVFKLKQNLWHSGLIATRAHSSAGRRSSDFHPEDDVWALEVPRARAELC